MGRVSGLGGLRAGGLSWVLLSGVRPGMVVATVGLLWGIMFQSRSAGSIQG